MAYVISDEGAYRLGLVLLFGNGLYLPIYLQKSQVFSDEGVYKLGLVLLFRYGLCLSTSFLETPRKLLYNYFWWRRLQIRVSVAIEVWFMPINKSLFISDEGVYKLGLVLPFRYGLCYFWWRRLQIRVSVTVREWLIPTKIPSETHVISYESACKLGKKRGYLWWRHLQIRVSDTVQMWLMSIDILSHSSSKFYIYRYTSHGSSKFYNS